MLEYKGLTPFMNKKSIQKYLDLLDPFVTENKKILIEKVLTHRTRQITIVLEDIFQPHNANATLRTSECLGIQDIHVIENRNAYSPSPQVTQGSGKWINLHRYNTDIQPTEDIKDPSGFATHNTEACFKELKSQDYQLIATSPDEQSVTINEIDLSQPIAFLFGTEKHGLSDYALENADATLRLPMVGFTQSYNISVSVAITLARITQRLWNSDIEWQLSNKEKSELRLEWYKKCIGIEKAKKILSQMTEE